MIIDKKTLLHNNNPYNNHRGYELYVMTRDKKNLIRKHTAAIHIRNDITAVERKISNVLLKHAFPNLMEHDKHQISVRDLMEEIGWSEGNFAPQTFINSVKNLNKTQVEWNILNKDKKRSWGVTTLLASVEIQDGIVFYSYSSALRQWLANPNIYATLDLEQQKKLSSKYSLALWEFAAEQLDSVRTCSVKTKPIDVELVRNLLAAKSLDVEFKTLNRNVLMVAAKEVNEKTDLKIKITKHLANRKVTKLSFDIERRIHQYCLDFIDEKMDSIELIKSNIEMENNLGKGKKLNIEEMKIMEYTARFGRENVSEALDALELKGIEKKEEGCALKEVLLGLLEERKDDAITFKAESQEVFRDWQLHSSQIKHTNRSFKLALEQKETKEEIAEHSSETHTEEEQEICEKMLELWKTLFDEEVTLSDTLMKKMLVFYSSYLKGDMQKWKNICSKVGVSKFLAGEKKLKDGKVFKASLFWVLDEKIAERILSEEFGSDREDPIVQKELKQKAKKDKEELDKVIEAFSDDQKWVINKIFELDKLMCLGHEFYLKRELVNGEFKFLVFEKNPKTKHVSIVIQYREALLMKNWHTPLISYMKDSVVGEYAKEGYTADLLVLGLSEFDKNQWSEKEISFRRGMIDAPANEEIFLNTCREVLSNNNLRAFEEEIVSGNMKFVFDEKKIDGITHMTIRVHDENAALHSAKKLEKKLKEKFRHYGVARLVIEVMNFRQL